MLERVSARERFHLLDGGFTLVPDPAGALIYLSNGRVLVNHFPDCEDCSLELPCGR